MNDHEFERLVRQYIPRVTAYARALCRDAHRADEAVQETLVRAWRYLDSYDRRGSFEGWLLRICRNCVIDLAQRDLRTVLSERDVLDTITLADTSSELLSLVRALPLPQREVLVLCGVLGYDYQGAAELLDIPVGTVRSRLHRARATLEQMLDGTATAMESA